MFVKILCVASFDALPVGVEDNVPLHPIFLLSPLHFCYVSTVKTLPQSFHHIFSQSATFSFYHSCSHQMSRFLTSHHMTEKQLFHHLLILLIRHRIDYAFLKLCRSICFHAISFIFSIILSPFHLASINSLIVSLEN